MDLEQVYKLTNVNIEDVKDTSEEQKRAIRNKFTNNIICYLLCYTEDKLIFEEEDTYKSFLYYGLEYVNKDAVFYFEDFYNETFLAIIDSNIDETGRVKKILEILQEE